MTGFLIHSAVEHWARVAPDRPAFCLQGEVLDYATLDARSNHLARVLVEDGLRPGERVGLCLHKSLELGVAIYAVLKAGGVFVPLDPFSPPERLDLLLEDCGIRHLVSADPLARTLGALGSSRELRVYGPSCELPFPVRSWASLAGEASAPPDVWQTDQDLAYIMYTSGSTGVPKGMMHTHLGSLTYARWGADHVGLEASDRVASHAPLHFDLSIFDFFSTAQAGGCVVLVPEPVTKFAASWTQLVQDERVSVVFTVPYTLIEMLERGALEQRDLTSLRWILFGGEPFPPKHLRALMEALPGARFTNVYGPAEAPSCTCFDVPVLAEDDDRPIPIGTVSRNSRDRIVDDGDAECPVGEEGELCIASSTLTRGYWRRPELNADAFLLRPGPGPFPEVYYRTGDIVVRDASGLLHFRGRKDRMVKTRGHRVELDEVEAALVAHPAVLEAAAFAVPDGAGSSRILAVALPTEPGALEAAELLRHARAQLPPYAVPREVEVVADLPRTSGGKIDRRALAQRVTQNPEPSES